MYRGPRRQRVGWIVQLPGGGCGGHRARPFARDRSVVLAEQQPGSRLVRVRDAAVFQPTVAHVVHPPAATGRA